MRGETNALMLVERMQLISASPTLHARRLHKDCRNAQPVTQEIARFQGHDQPERDR